MMPTTRAMHQRLDTARTYATDVLSNICMSFTDRSVNHWVDGASS